MKKRPTLIGLVLACITSPVYAQDAQTDTSAESPAVPEKPITSPVSPPSSPHWVVSEAELSSLRGGEMIAVGNQTLIGITQGNILNGDYTAGSVAISENALSNFSGVGNLVINTGGQVTLQSGLNLVINVSN